MNYLIMKIINKNFFIEEKKLINILKKKKNKLFKQENICICL